MSEKPKAPRTPADYVTVAVHRLWYAAQKSLTLEQASDPTKLSDAIEEVLWRVNAAEQAQKDWDARMERLMAGDPEALDPTYAKFEPLPSYQPPSVTKLTCYQCGKSIPPGSNYIKVSPETVQCYDCSIKEFKSKSIGQQQNPLLDPELRWLCPDCLNIFPRSKRSHVCKDGNFVVFERSAPF